MRAPQRKTAAIDWSTIRRRMQEVQMAIDGASALSAAQQAAILRARARALAREPAAARHVVHSFDIVEFLLSYERYAVDASYVREVHPLKDITPLPGVPAFVAGIVNVRGQIVSVIDLKQFFELPPKGLTDLNRVIILEDGAMEFGLLVDAVTGAHRLELDAIQPALPTLAGRRAEYLHGVTAQRTIVLSAAKLLGDRNLICEQQEIS